MFLFGMFVSNLLVTKAILLQQVLYPPSLYSKLSVTNNHHRQETQKIPSSIFMVGNPYIFIPPKESNDINVDDDNDEDGFVTLLQIMHNSTLFVETFGADIRLRGTLLLGPNKKQKTEFVRALAKRTNCPIIRVSSSRVMNLSDYWKTINLQHQHRQLRQLPSIVFVEIDDNESQKKAELLVASIYQNTNKNNDKLLFFVASSANESTFLPVAAMDRILTFNNQGVQNRSQMLKEQLKKHSRFFQRVSLSHIEEITSTFKSDENIDIFLVQSILQAKKQKRDIVTIDDMETAHDQMLLGHLLHPREISQLQFRQVAIHEIGHAFVAFYCEKHANPRKVVLTVHSPSYIGATFFPRAPDDAPVFATRDEMFQHLMVLLAGRAAEVVLMNNNCTSAGSQTDLEAAMRLTYHLVAKYGLGTKIVYPLFSEESRYQMDQEIYNLFIEAFLLCKKIVVQNKDVIEALVQELLKKKKLTNKEMSDIIVFFSSTTILKKN